MKPTMLFVILAATAIILAASFGLQIGDMAPIYNLSPDQMAVALYACPAADSTFDMFANALRIGARYMNMFFFFTCMLLVFIWIWNLYQNLLSDKFDAKKFEKPWEFTKVWFWALIIFTVLTHTPNFYRTVSVDGATGNYVLCESNTPGAIPVRATAVKSK